MSYRSIHGIMHQAQELAQAVDAISTQPNLSGKFKKFLHKYYMVEMLEHDFSKLVAGNTVIHQGVVYEIYFTNVCDNIYPDTKLALSFRQTKHILNCPNYVVVTIKE